MLLTKGKQYRNEKIFSIKRSLKKITNLGSKHPYFKKKNSISSTFYKKISKGDYCNAVEFNYLQIKDHFKLNMGIFISGVKFCQCFWLNPDSPPPPPAIRA